MSDIKNINFKKGTLNFWIPAGLFEYDDNIAHILVNYMDSMGSIFIVKDDDNKLKLSHVVIGKGRTDAEVDVSRLSSRDRHMVTATWSLDKKEIRLYVDGNKSQKGAKIEYE